MLRARVGAGGPGWNDGGRDTEGGGSEGRGGGYRLE